MRPTGNEVIDDPCEYMAQLAQRILPLEKWGFEGYCWRTGGKYGI